MRSTAGATFLRPRAIRSAVLLTLLGGALPACAATVTVFAAASLTDAFRTIGKDFEQAHPGTKVEFNFASSSTLARQIIEGAPADVFASADEENMKKVVDAGDVTGEPKAFVANRLAIIVPHGNPKHVQGLSDLSAHGMIVSLAAPAVPVGHYAVEAFGKAGVPVPNASQEADVKAVVMRVSMGEADAGIAYVTDVAAAVGKVEAVAIPDGHNVTAHYPIATLKGAPNAAGAKAFMAAVLSPPGQAVLRRAGFLAP